MKKFLLASAAVALLHAAPARAQVDFSGGPGTIVFDPTSYAELVTQLTTMQQQLQGIINTYNTAVHIWDDLEELVGADGYAAGLTSAEARNPLPFPASAFPGYVAGITSPANLPYAPQYLDLNTVGGDLHAFADGTFVGSELVRIVQSLSALQGVHTNNLSSIEERIHALGDLFARLGNIATLQETASLSARLHSEQQYIAAQQKQSADTLAAAQMQWTVFQARQTQWLYIDQNNGVTAACNTIAATGSGLYIPACAGGGG